MSTNNVYFVDMERRFEDIKAGKVNMRALHCLVYEYNNVALAVRQLSKSPGRMAKGSDGTNFATLEPYSIAELAEIVRERLITKKMDYVRRTYIPKGNGKSGKFRPLGICSVWDKLVEKCIQLVIEPCCETKFVDSSFGFREQVSAHDALAKVKLQCQTMPYILAVDMKDYFGTIDPDVAYRELWHIGIRDQVILNYLYRFIKKGYYADSCKIEDPRGAPQGSILGPLISNVYLHRFDVWLRDQGDCWHDAGVRKFHCKKRRRNLSRTGLKVGIHVRYADDILVLCKEHDDAVKFKYSIIKYLTQNMKLEINEEKTRIYDLTREKMKFLGYDFYVVKSSNPKLNTGHMTVNTLPADKGDAIVDRCKTLLWAIKRNPTPENMMAWNAYVVGIHNYYRGMNRFYWSFRKIGWRIKKLFYHTMSRTVEFMEDQSCKDNFLGGRYKSWGKNGYYCFGGIPLIEIQWANWDMTLLAATKCKVSRSNPYAYGKNKHKPGVSMDDISYLANTSKYIKSSRLALFRISKYSSAKAAVRMVDAARPVALKRPLIFVCSPYSGDVETNVWCAECYCHFVYEQNGIPFAPHLLFTHFLDDAKEADREAGITMGIEMLRLCDELWAFDEPTTGMRHELDAAKALGKKVRRFNGSCQEVAE